jgi:Fur family zinc uptake transcriptional regulator
MKNCQHSSFIEHANEKLKRAGFKLTKARCDIINEITKIDKAISPYKLQEICAKAGKKYSAITIYRVLETLSENQLIHKVYCINGYMKCSHDEYHEHRLLVCKSCHSVDLIDRPREDSTFKNFTKLETIDEVLGICDNCAETKS